MKNSTHIVFIVFAGMLAIFQSCQPAEEIYLFTSFHEPADEGLRLLFSYDGYHWTDLDTVFLKPEVGKQKVMRDPSMVQGPDGVFHLVWTSSWQGDPGFGYASSTNLIHWSAQQFIPVMDFDTSTVNVWAPELFYDEEGEQFILIWASTIPYKFEKGIEEERNNHRMYYTTTKDFQSFSETKLFLDPGFSVIDAVIVKKGDQDYVLVLKDNTRPNRNLKTAFGKSVLGPYSDISEAFTEFLTEGPTVLKIGGEWLIYYDAYGDNTYRALRTKDFRTFEDITGEISIPEGHKHGTICKTKEDLLINIQKTIKADAEAKVKEETKVSNLVIDNTN